METEVYLTLLDRSLKMEFKNGAESCLVLSTLYIHVNILGNLVITLDMIFTFKRTIKQYLITKYYFYGKLFVI